MPFFEDEKKRVKFDSFWVPLPPLTPHSAGSYTYVIDFSGFWHFEVFCSSDVILRVQDWSRLVHASHPTSDEFHGSRARVWI